MHIGFGSSLSDSFPAWMGYSTHYQFGQRVSPDIEMTQEIEIGGESVKVEIPMTVGFFWPKAAK